MMHGLDLGFPLGVRLTHWFNLLFMTMLVRSGIQILSAHPKLYWSDHCLPGTEWIRFTKKKMPADQLWTSTDEEESWSPWIALPGGLTLGLGRYWHFVSMMGWCIAGVLYFFMLFTTPQWQRLIPTSWTIFPDAWHNLVDYLSFRLPPEGTTANPLHPYNALQQLSYFLVVFWFTPHMILTGLAMSPAILSRFRNYPRIFYSRQAARSLHFIGMVAYLGFFLIHITMVLVHGFANEMEKMVLGRTHLPGTRLAAALGLAIIAAVVVAHVVATYASHKRPRVVHRALSALVDPPRRLIFHHIRPVENYPEDKISPYFRVNGYPPVEQYPRARDDDYIRLRQNGFVDWRLEVTGLVENPLSLTLDELRALPRQDQITMHNCIQGWTSIGKWTGVHMREILSRCKPLPNARYLVFRSYQRHEHSGEHYYECIDFELAGQPQTILAYELNDQPLPLEHGSPLRLRVENQLGFKMVKFLRAIEIVEDYRCVGADMGGVREDFQQFNLGAEI